MDETTIANYIGEIVAVLALPLVAWALRIARRWQINGQIINAVVRGAGEAYMTILDNRQGLTKAVVDRALDSGRDYVTSRIAGPLAKDGKTAEDVRGMIRGQLGNLLAADPTVSLEPAQPTVRVKPQ